MDIIVQTNEAHLKQFHSAIFVSSSKVYIYAADILKFFLNPEILSNLVSLLLIVVDRAVDDVFSMMVAGMSQ